MEFKLNKIDTDVRQRINDATREGKIHSKNGITISKDLKDEDREKPKFQLPKDKNNKKKMIVKAVKVVKEDDDINRETSRGRFVDVRK